MNAIARKDLLGLFRLRRVAAIQVAFVATLVLMVLTSWPQAGVLPIATQGRDDLLLGLVIGQLLLLCLFVPGVAAVGIVGEREENTLEMLYASRLSPASLVIGKIISAVSFPLLLLATGLPFVALLMWRGDVNLGLLAGSYAIILTTAIFLAMLSLAVSALCRQTSTALVMSYLLILTLCGGLLVPAAVMLESSTDISAEILHYARSLSPLAAALSLLRPAMDGDFSGQTHQNLPLWQTFFPAVALVTLGCFFLLVLKLRRPPSETERTALSGEVTEIRSMGRRVMYLLDDKKKRKPMGIVNPVASKERRTSSLRSGKWMIRTFYASLVMSLGLALMSLAGDPEHPDLLAHVAGILVALQLGLIAMLDPSLTSPMISSELESGTWETLRTSPLKAGTIFRGKLIPAVPSSLLPVLAMLPAYGAVCFVDHSYIDRFLPVLPLVLMAVALCLSTGLACSTLFRNSARATVAAYLIVSAIFVLPMLAWFAAGSQLDERLARWFAMPSPLVMALNLLPGGSQFIADLWRLHLIVIGSISLLMLIIARVRLSYLLKRG
jgi:ABC-type transport system involved in multi-copper enzyme maturation permease subunit